MKNLKLILLLQAFMLGALTLNAQDCPCEGGTAEYSVDCDEDGTMDACDTSECDPCTTANPDPKTEGYECCGGEEFDPDMPWGNAYSMSLNLSQLLAACNDALNQSPIDVGCKFDEPSVTGKITGQLKDDCCSDVKVELRKFTGTVQVGTQARCSAPVPVPFTNVPLVAKSYLIFIAGVNGSMSASTEETCDETNVCFNVNLGVTGGVGGSVEVLEGVIRGEATLTLSGGVVADYCTEEDEISGVDVCFSGMTGSVLTSAVWGLWEYSHDYVWSFGGC